MKKDNKVDFQEIYSNFKEAWKDPRKKAGIKLLGYFIFFFILILVSAIMNNIDNNKSSSNDVSTTITTTETDKFIDKQNDLLTNKYSINYVINVNSVEYKINGNIENGIVYGYLESIDDIKKIIIKDNNIYEVSNSEEIILELDINKDFVDVNYIIDLIKQNSALIESVEDGKNYSYNINDINAKIIVYTSETSITQISIVSDVNSYLLSFDN